MYINAIVSKIATPVKPKISTAYILYICQFELLLYIMNCNSNLSNVIIVIGG